MILYQQYLLELRTAVQHDIAEQFIKRPGINRLFKEADSAFFLGIGNQFRPFGRPVLAGRVLGATRREGKGDQCGGER